MTCQDFLARHSEYVDLVMDPLDEAVWRDHAQRCSTCASYDRVLRRGLSILRDLPTPEPSEDFVPRLEYSLRADAGEERAGRKAGTGTTLTLAIAASLALLAWAPMLRDGGGIGVTIGSMAGESPVRQAGSSSPAVPPVEATAVQLAAEGGDRATDAAFAAGAGGWWWGSGAGSTLDRVSTTFPAVRTVGFQVPGPHSPLVVGSPSFRSASTLRRHESSAQE